MVTPRKPGTRSAAKASPKAAGGGASAAKPTAPAKPDAPKEAATTRARAAATDSPTTARARAAGTDVPTTARSSPLDEVAAAATPPFEVADLGVSPVAEPLEMVPWSRGIRLREAPPAEVAPALATPQRAAIDAAFEERAELRRGLTENLQPLRAEGVAVAGRVTNAFAGWNPMALSTDAPEGRNYVAPDADPGPALDAVIERRVAAVKEAAPHSRMTIRKAAGAHGPLSAVTGGAGATKIKLGPLVDYISVRSDTLTAFDSTPAVAACVAEATATDIVAEVDAAAPAAAGGGTPSGNGAPDPKDVDELVARTVNRQMRSATAPEDRLVYGRIPTGDHDDPTQAALLETFELRPGASDVTSYHDFNTLQIAFEHVWTSIFDGQIEAIGRQLYKEYVGLKDFLGDNSADRAISTIDDLRRLMAEIQSLSEIAQVDLPPALSGPTPGKQPPAQSGSDLDNAVRVVGGVATGGLSIVIEWAIREFAKLGQKPVLTWDQVNGGKLARGDRITAKVEQGVAPAGLVELVLETDSNSKVKLFSFQQYVEQAGKFTNVVFVDNRAMNMISRGGVSYFTSSAVVGSALLPSAMIEFASEQTSAIDTPGRYCLGKLGDRLRDRSRVTFYWQDF